MVYQNQGILIKVAEYSTQQKQSTFWNIIIILLYYKNIFIATMIPSKPKNSEFRIEVIKVLEALFCYFLFKFLEIHTFRKKICLSEKIENYLYCLYCILINKCKY